MTTSYRRLLDNREWKTVVLGALPLVRRYVSRLDALRYDYQLVLDDRQIRILVRRHEFDEILDWMTDLATTGTSRSNREVFDHGQQIRLLIAIPIGAGFGSLFAAVLGSPNPTLSGLSALGAGVLALLTPLGLQPTTRAK